MELPKTSYKPVVLNGYYVDEDTTTEDGFYCFENTPGFLLTDGKYCAIVDCIEITDKGEERIYSQVLKVVPVYPNLSE